MARRTYIAPATIFQRSAVIDAVISINYGIVFKPIKNDSFSPGLYTSHVYGLAVGRGGSRRSWSSGQLACSTSNKVVGSNRVTEDF